MFKLLVQLFSDLIHTFREILEKDRKIMAKLNDVQTAIAELKAQVETEHAEVKAAVDTAVANLNAEIQALKDQIAGGTAATEADLDGLVALVNDVKAAVGTISDEVVTS